MHMEKDIGELDPQIEAKFLTAWEEMESTGNRNGWVPEELWRL